MNTTKKGDKLEIAVFNILKREIDAGRLWGNKDTSRIFRKKGYHSRDRECDIVFDISIEIWRPGAKTYTALFIIECKNYAHPVPVNDVEELFTKVQQVGPANTKSILISSNILQSGALTFCRSKGMGVARYFAPDQLKWELERSAAMRFANKAIALGSEFSAAFTQPEYRSSVFSFFMQAPSINTHSIGAFLESLMLEGCLPDDPVRLLRRTRQRQADIVPYISSANIERCAQEALALTGSDVGRVDLDRLCSNHPKTSDLLLLRTKIGIEEAGNHPLARITFNPLCIEIFEMPMSPIGRDRFTLAHELGHLLLGHGRYLRAERRDEADHEGAERVFDDGTALQRIEHQANYFASCLLMPRAPFVEAFGAGLHWLDLHDKGFGPLYVDGQQCNIDNYFVVTGRLMTAFGVSRSAVAIRLNGLGLLRDVRKASSSLTDGGFLNHLLTSERRPEKEPEQDPETW